MGEPLKRNVGLLLLSKAKEKTEYLASLDAMLEPRGFRRRRNDQEWRFPLDDANELWIHINFGKAVVNPSVGVSYIDLVSVLPKDAGPVTGSMTMLPSISPASPIYTIEEGGARVAHDLQEVGIPFLFRLKDRAFVIERLKSALPTDWPTVSYSHRIRLLPLLLASDGRIAEARKFLEDFCSESSGRDQMLPQYDVFAAAFGKRFGC